MNRLFSTAIAMVVCAGLLLGEASAQGEVPSKLIFGIIPSREADVIIDNLEPIAAMLAERLGLPVETFIATDYVGLVEAIGTGRVDIGLMGPAAIVQAIDNYGATVILASVREGATAYRSQFNVRCDSGITSFEQLRGKTIAFVDPGSASGYQFPYVTLKNTYGIDPDKDMTAIFAGSHDAATLAVYNGDVDVAVTFGGNAGSDGRETIEAEYPDVKDVVCILGYSDYIPNDGIVVREGLDPQLVEQITQGMIDIADSPAGKALTETLFFVTGFERVDAAAFDIVREVSATFRR
ncbi:MAG TPA: phosphate/phosphite/phosphonate ABC transporter substrate-binding protein [Trueperaceae bacterium]|nr:phosphate/phosphite/phosphonate ABC transporter substrate-binding protein [Trueperaceae bacterium]